MVTIVPVILQFEIHPWCNLRFLDYLFHLIPWVDPCTSLYALSSQYIGATGSSFIARNWSAATVGAAHAQIFPLAYVPNKCPGVCCIYNGHLPQPMSQQHHDGRQQTDESEKVCKNKLIFVTVMASTIQGGGLDEGLPESVRHLRGLWGRQPHNGPGVHLQGRLRGRTSTHSCLTFSIHSSDPQQVTS